MSFYDAIRVGSSGAADDFTIDRSLRFNDGDTPYLNRTPSSAPTSGQKVTFSIWFKILTLHTVRTLFANLGGGNGLIIQIDANDDLYIYDFSAATNGWQITSDFKLRDVSAWYHLVVAIDTTQATDSNRAKVYINGELKPISSWSIGGGASRYPTQNVTLDFNANGDGLAVGGRSSGSQPWDGYLAEVNVIDGQQLTPSSFAETKATTGQWIPIDTAGLTFGTNGFRLQFADNSGTTATTLGKDTSGNGNNFTPNNFSVAAGVENDSSEDTPTNNWCTLNPIFRFSGRNPPNFFNAATEINNTGGGDLNTHGTFAVKSGKYYFEGIPTGVSTSGGGTHFIGIQESYPGHVNQGFWRNPGTVYDQSASGSDIGTSYDSNDVIGVAFDADTGKVWFAKNNTFAGSGDPANGNNPAFTYSTTEHLQPAFAFDNTSNGKKWFVNFGQRPFTYTPPTGYVSLNSANLADPTILLPNKHFEALLYTTSGSTLTITGLQFDPDWAWLKNRSIAYSPEVYDTVRGDGKRIFPDSNNVENTSGALSFGVTGGYSIVNSASINDSGVDNIATWNWNAGETDSKTYTVKVVSDSGNKYRFDNFGTSAVTLDLAEGGTYIFNMDDATNATHPFSIGTAANGTVYTSGITYFLDGVSKTYSQYTSGFSSATTRRLHITVPASAPVLYYWCSAHSGMGGQINTNSTFGSSNFDGSIQSTVKANASAGFSVVSYTGTGADGTVGHGLGVTPSAIILKNRDRSVDWAVKHKSLTSGYINYLNLTGAEDGATGGNNGIIADLSSSSNFSITRTSNSGNYNMVGVNGEKYIAYCFSEVAGYSKFGTYKGNGNADGTFIYTGFKPAFVLTKGTWGGNWNIYDNKRPGRNVTNDILYPNLNNVEYDGSSSDNQMDLVANGFKLRGSDADTNQNGSTFIYLAFAESPFKNNRAR